MRNFFTFSFLVFIFFNISIYAGTKNLTPSQVVQSYCEADADGAGLSSKTSYAIFRLTTWEDGPGWDIYSVIIAFKIGAENISGSSATVHVSYDVVGSVSNDIVSDKIQEIVDFILDLTPEGWKIREPQLQPHVSLKTVLQREIGHPQYSVLENWAAQPSH